MSARRLHIEPSGERELFRCPDCGNLTRQIWGFVETETEGVREAYAAYFMRWTDARLDHGIVVALSIGGWGGNTRHKVLIGLECSVDAGEASCRFIDALETPFARNQDANQLGETLAAQEVLAGPLAQEAMELVAALQVCDRRFANFLANRT